MKKQYFTEYIGNGKRRIHLYEDGKLIMTEEYKDAVPLYESESFHERVEDLKSQGFIYGYTPKEVEEAKETYFHKKNNLIYPAYLPPCCKLCDSTNLEPTEWDGEVIHYTCLSCNNDWVRGNYPFEEEEEE
jgi:hypothetical protein